MMVTAWRNLVTNHAVTGNDSSWNKYFTNLRMQTNSIPTTTPLPVTIPAPPQTLPNAQVNSLSATVNGKYGK
jgi:hypothetical protein